MPLANEPEYAAGILEHGIRRCGARGDDGSCAEPCTIGEQLETAMHMKRSMQQPATTTMPFMARSARARSWNSSVQCHPPSSRQFP